MMSQDIYICFSHQCQEKACVGTKQEVKKHQNNYSIDHTFIKVKKMHQKCDIVNSKIQLITSQLAQLKKNVVDITAKILKSIESIKDETILKIDNVINDYWSISLQSEKETRTMGKKLQKRQFNSFSCNQMKLAIDLIQSISKDINFEKRQRPKIEKLKSQFISSYQSSIKSNINKAFVNIRNSQGSIFSTSVSTIVQQYTIVSNGQDNSILKELDLSVQPTFIKFQNQPNVPKVDMKKIKKITHISDDSSGFMSQSSSNSAAGSSIRQASSKSESMNSKKQQPKVLKKCWRAVTENKSQVSKQIKQDSSLSSYLKSAYFQDSSNSIGTILSAFKRQADSLFESQGQNVDQPSMYASEDEISSQEENEDKLNQTLIEIKSQIMCKKRKSVEDNSFETIQSISKKVNEQILFSIKVQIIKIIYYSVLSTNIPKIKFVAGDHTGYALFFTNFCPGMKVNSQLEIIDCTFHVYRGSVEIRNDKNFRIMAEHEPRIITNLKGVKLNKILTKDLHYPLQDRRCILIRQIAQRLKKNTKTFKIYRMTVKVVAIIDQWSHGLFCLVGDSSGMMMAYLKKQPLKDIKEGGVIRLLQPRGERGRDKNKQLKESQIIYIDTYFKQSKVLPHRFDFLQICKDVMAPK